MGVCSLEKTRDGACGGQPLREGYCTKLTWVTSWDAALAEEVPVPGWDLMGRLS